MASSQTSLYYALQVMPDSQSKDDAMAALDDDFKDLFSFEEEAELKNEPCIPCGE
jgi:hypothetical protein